MIACKRRYYNIVKLLVKNNININLVDNLGDNALMYAVKDKDYKNIKDKEIINIIKLLIDSGININNTNKDGDNALIYAIDNDQTSIVKFFLENKNLNINIVNNNNNSIINYIKSHKTFNIIKDYVNQENNNKKICKYIIHFINSYYTIHKTKRYRQTIVPKLVRQISLKAQKQDGGTCFAHAISRCILHLIKNYVPNYFTSYKQNYIQINNLNDFKSYLDRGEFNFDAMYFNNILYYYFYIIITNEFGCNGEYT
jgi:hypothetical protein